MSDDPLLRELIRVAREEREAEFGRLDARWDALSVGALRPEEEEKLRALAEESPEAAAAWEAFRPLGDEFRTRVAEAARFQLKARGPAAGAEPSRASTPAVGAVPGRRPRWWLPGAAVAAAASLLLFLWPARELPPLPAYGLELDGHVHEMRSPSSAADEQRKLFTAGNRLRLVLTPSTTVPGPVAVRAFSLGTDGLRPLEAPPATISASGAVRIEGDVGGDVRLPSGDSWLLVVVGRADSLPVAEELRSRLEGSESLHTAAWTAWRVAVRLEQVSD